MKSKLFTALVLNLVLIGGVGCAGGSGSKEAENDNVEEKLRDKITPESCMQGGTATNVEGSWLSTLEGQNIVFNVVFNITSSNITLTNYCEIMGTSLTARVSSPISHYYGKLKVWNSDEDSVKYDDGRTKAECNVSIPAGEINYEFYGNCLVVKNGSERMYLKKL